MGSSGQTVTLTEEQVAELNRKLATLRHDVNNNLSLMTAAVELIRFKPELSERMMETLAEQPAKITDAMARFTDEFEKVFGISRT